MSVETRPALRGRIPPAGGTRIRLGRGSLLRVVDPEGEQVADLMAIAEGDAEHWLSAGRTFDYEETIRLTAGNALWSNRSARMLTIVEDTCGVHDFLLTPCSPEMFTLLRGWPEGHGHASCLTNLARELAPLGMDRDRIPTTFNAFMNVQVHGDGRISVEPPTSRPGDFVTFRAEMDLTVALTACASEATNNGRLKPIDYEVLPPPGEEPSGGSRV